jgi:transmembrane sensor
MEQSTERIWILIARKISGDASVEEQAELEQLLLQSPRENYSMEILYDLWNSKVEQNHQYAENKYKELVLRMQHKGINEGKYTDNEKLILSDTESKRKTSKKWLLWLCSLLVISLAVFFLLQNNGAFTKSKQPEPLAKNEIKTTNGSKTNLVLPDGTKVWLNAGSNMTYDKDYGVNIREVNLTGEAYFDVIKNPKKPFIIHTGKIDIKVLGTAFNVRCYPDEKNTETSLVRGKDHS